MDKLIVYFDFSNSISINEDSSFGMPSKLFYKVIENDNLVFMDNIDFNEIKNALISDKEYNIYGSYYYGLLENSSIAIFYKKDDDNKIPIFVEYLNTVNYFGEVLRPSFYIKMSAEIFEFTGGRYPLNFFVNDGIFHYKNDDFVYNDKHYKIDIIFDFKSQVLDVYFAEIVDNVESPVAYVVDYSSLYSFLNPSRVIDERCYEISGNFYNFSQGIENSLNEINTPLNNLSDKCNDINTKLSDIDKSLNSLNCDVDLTPLENAINGVSLKIDGLVSKIENIKFDVNDTGLGILGLSLNGSAGAKFKDGELVSVQGYNGSWKVLGSYPVLNKDNVLTILYALKNEDRTMLVPSVFVKAVEG